MNTIAHGIDVVEISRIAALVDAHGERFLARVFTPEERAHAEGKRNASQHLAARFAVKEAVMKVLGTGWSNGIAWTDIEVVRQPTGRPVLRLYGRASEIARGLGIASWHVSITHTQELAMASVIGCGGS